MKYFFVALYTLALGFTIYSAAHHLPHSHRIRPGESLENASAQTRWDYLRLRDPATGEIPRGIHVRELAFAERMISTRASYMTDASIHATGWQSVGPINGGGRTQAI